VPQFLVGVDLAQSADYTAIGVLERTTTAEHRDPRLALRHLDRFQGRSYLAVAGGVRDLVARLTQEAPGHERIVVFDRTGVGAAVGDVMREAQIDASLIPVLIHGGDQVVADNGVWRVPKRDIVSALIVPFQNGTLRIAPGLPLASILAEELATFKLRFDPRTAHDSYAAWREGQHDDTVLAVGLAAWWSTRYLGGPLYVPCAPPVWAGWGGGWDDDDW
jgi:hypothetical protein